MNRRFSSRVLLALLVLGIVMTIGLNRTKACGPFYSEPVFVSGERPDLPYTRFVAGDVGLVRPKWARSYLAVRAGLRVLELPGRPDHSAAAV